MSGNETPALATLDRTMTDLMRSWKLPGAQLALARAGRLVFDRGYGFADIEANEPVRPDHRFRFASVSKTMTAVAVLRLVERGLLSLDDAVFPLLDLEPPPGAELDPRLDRITVRDLLVHAGGWNSSASGDPQYWPTSIAAAVMMGDLGPPSAETLIRYMLGQPLDFDPGTASVYSNFGYNVAGRVIERLSGLSYETFIQQEVFDPAGATGIQLGKTRLIDRAEREVRYYAPAELPATAPSVFAGEGYGSWAYGSFYLESMDSHGGWIGRAADLLRYATAVDGQRGEALLQPATIETMVSTLRPSAAGPNDAGSIETVAGLGFRVQHGPTGQEWMHLGALSGSTSALLLRFGDATWLAFVANTLPSDMISFFEDLQATLTTAVSELTSWPDWDLFELDA